MRITGTGSVWSNYHSLYVAGVNNILQIDGGGKLLSKNGYLANFLATGNNSVIVTDPGSVWSNKASGTLRIGNSGVYGNNSLIISNGGRVISWEAFVGYGSGSNRVLVTGTDSIWNVATLLGIGYGWESGLVITEGGQVSNTEGYIGEGSGCSNNYVIVTGDGSVWNSGYLAVGLHSAGNTMVISNGGKVVGSNGYVGYYGEAPSNSVRVLNEGIWLQGVLHVGENASANSLFVDGGSVVANDVVVGYASASCDNLMMLDSGIVLVTNANSSAVLEVRRGKLVLNGGTLQVDRFVMTNACAQFVRTGGSLIYGTAVLDPNLDADGDAIPNGYEQSHGLDPLDPVNTTLDSDGDGLTDLQEYLTGTDPTNSASAFRITSVVRTGDDVFVSWMTGIGRTNALQPAPAAGDGGYYTNGFADIFTVTNTVGTTTNYLDIGAATNVPSRFYRIRLVP